MQQSPTCYLNFFLRPCLARISLRRGKESHYNSCVVANLLSSRWWPANKKEYKQKIIIHFRIRDQCLECQPGAVKLCWWWSCNVPVPRRKPPPEFEWPSALLFYAACWKFGHCAPTSTTVVLWDHQPFLTSQFFFYYLHCSFVLLGIEMKTFFVDMACIQLNTNLVVLLDIKSSTTFVRHWDALKYSGFFTCHFHIQRQRNNPWFKIVCSEVGCKSPFRKVQSVNAVNFSCPSPSPLKLSTRGQFLERSMETRYRGIQHVATFLMTKFWLLPLTHITGYLIPQENVQE